MDGCRGMKVLENRGVTDEERIGQLQRELEAAILLGEDTDRKFEEVTSRRYYIAFPVVVRLRKLLYAVPLSLP